MSKLKHLVLTSNSGTSDASSIPICCGEIDPLKRRHVIGSLTKSSHRNAIGTHSGSYSVDRALAVASGILQADHRPDFTNTSPAEHIGPHDGVGATPTKLCLSIPLGVWSAKFTAHYPCWDTIFDRQLL
ncbi:MAG: hypothetical protein WCD53_26545 [Microcoleus sp.]